MKPKVELGTWKGHPRVFFNPIIFFVHGRVERGKTGGVRGSLLRFLGLIWSVFLVVETNLFGLKIALEILFLNESDQPFGALILKVGLPQSQIRNLESMLVEKGRMGYRLSYFGFQLVQAHTLLVVHLAHLHKLINILLRQLRERRNE